MNIDTLPGNWTPINTASAASPFPAANFTFTPLASTNRHGKPTSWTMIVTLERDKAPQPILEAYLSSQTPLPAGLVAVITVESGVAGGKIRDVQPTIVAAGKNLGRANATNALTQALRDALGKYNTQARKKVVASAAPEATGHTVAASGSSLHLPMLASEYKSELLDPAVNFVQPKFNGVRAVAFLDTAATGVTIYSRTLKLYQGLPRVRADLGRLLGALEYPGLYLDGEIYCHGMSLQEISGLVRRLKADSGAGEALADNLPHSKAEQLVFQLYDCFDPARPQLTASERQLMLLKAASIIKAQGLTHVKTTETREVKTDQEVQAAYREFMDSGHEGAIVRPGSAPYVYSVNSYHSNALLKLKPVFDAEYRAVGFTAGAKGKSAGALLLIFETPSRDRRLEQRFKVADLSPKQFTCSVSGKTIVELKEMFRLWSTGDYFAKQIKGKWLTVEFAELSTAGIPVRATCPGLVVRDYD